jgi:Tol biopolymer transport system component
MWFEFQRDYPEFEKKGLPPPTVETIDVPPGYHGKLAYTYKGGLRVLDLETGLRKHYRGASLMVAPTWHPGGEWLACGHGEIYLINTKTHAFINATRSPHFDIQSDWSPDGKSIVFVRNALSAPALRGLYRLQVDTLQAEQISLGMKRVYHPSWSPDGSQIAFAGRLEGERYAQIRVANTSCFSSGDCPSTQLTQPPKQSQYPSWSPDGSQITFESKREGTWAIYVMNADGSNQQRITDNPDRLPDMSPCWSPDGEFIVFIRREIVEYKTTAEGHQYPTRRSNFFIMRPDGSEVTRVVADGGGDPAWWMDTSGAK